MSTGTIILITLVIALLGGFSGIGGAPFYGAGYYGGWRPRRRRARAACVGPPWKDMSSSWSPANMEAFDAFLSRDPSSIDDKY